ncbi:hypothetical protein HGM15179_018210 [Zosterops borbonicus]|uniref:Bardet-Biedl syndrome 1 protein GAE domain-containing protein n=1 Tax=Zosterops borbonicus TaxID=364589 RepID=A0A8K1FZF1_9PASS|nr:hypothetical protein HGM15179_018210 [Zosterops borbonicus]
MGAPPCPPRLLALSPPELGPFVALHKGRPLQRQGRRQWALRLPGPVVALAGAALPGRGLGALRLYRGRTLLCTIATQVQGLGPRLRLTLGVLLPGGAPPTPNLVLLLRCHPPPKRLQPPCIKVPLLLPGLRYLFGTWLEPGGGPGRIQVLVLAPGREGPVLTAQVGLPPVAT